MTRDDFLGLSAEAWQIYESAFRTNTAPKLLIDPTTGRIRDANPSALQFYGYTLAEIREKKITEINTLRPEQIAWEMEQARQKKRPYFEFQHRLANGDIRDVLVYSGPLNLGGKEYLHSIIHDVTETNHYQERLARFREMFMSLPVGLYRNTPGPEGRFLEVNDAMVEIFEAASRQELLETPVARLYANPEERQFFNDRLLEKGQVLGEEIHFKTLRGRQGLCRITAKLVTGPDGETIYEGALEDISRLREQEKLIRQSDRILESTSDGVLVTDLKGNIVSVNQAFCRITGYPESEILGMNPRVLKSGRHDRQFYQRIWKSIRDTGKWQGEIWNRRKNGEVFPVWQTINSVVNRDGKSTNYVGVFSDLSKIRQSQTELEFLIHHDPLTQLPNRLLFRSRLDHAMGLVDQKGYEKLAVVMLDLDGFRTINDTFGHRFGDNLVLKVSEMLKELISPDDTLARFGGDEFLLLLEGVGTLESLARRLEKIDQALQRQVEVNGHSIWISASMGVVLYPEGGDSVERLIRNADTALHRAKQDKGTAFHFYSEEMTRQAHKRLVLENELRLALRRDQLQLAFQSQFDLETSRLAGVEALCRWEHPELGKVSPAVFIPYAEESDLILELGDWVLSRACEQAARWDIAGHDFGRLAINVSAGQLQTGQLVDRVREVLDQTGLEAQRLELEITESVLMTRNITQFAQLEELRRLGISLAMDDFGTGYSSLAYLRRLPIQKLKLDRSFVEDLPEDDNAAAITRAVVGLGQALNLTVLAEGVETSGQRKFLSEAGVKYGQGYLWARPTPEPAWQPTV